VQLTPNLSAPPYFTPLNKFCPLYFAVNPNNKRGLFNLYSINVSILLDGNSIRFLINVLLLIAYSLPRNTVGLDGSSNLIDACAAN